jgi:hypothetical protein
MVSKENIMTTITDYTAHNENRWNEQELITRLELRRRAAEKGVDRFGSRLAFAAHLAARARAASHGVVLSA